MRVTCAPARSSWSTAHNWMPSPQPSSKRKCSMAKKFGGLPGSRQNMQRRPPSRQATIIPRLPQPKELVMAVSKSTPAARLHREVSVRPRVMGILNVTPDSFSDGGRYGDPNAAVSHAEQMEAEGADLIDVGGESTRPGAAAVPLEEELRRTIPVIRRLAKTVRVPLSIDTSKAEVAERALDAGASIVNDVTALPGHPTMASV